MRLFGWRRPSESPRWRECRWLACQCLGVSSSMQYTLVILSWLRVTECWRRWACRAVSLSGVVL